MTEFQIGAGLQETNNKGKKQQATKTNSASVKDIALFVFGLLNELNNYDGVVINPPRNGAKSQCQIIAKSNIKIVVMVSCNPQTFSTDVKELLENGYSMKKVVGIDQFYRTQHLEIVGVLTK